MKEIQLTQGKIAVVDDADMWLNQWKWCCNNGYAVRADYSTGKQKNIRMHREIMNPAADVQIDHIDGNPLNNQRSNLRICTCAENMRNQKKSKDNTSGFKGVSWKKDRNKWESYIAVNNKRIHLGYFANIDNAADAYKQASIKYHGEFRRQK